MSKFAREKPMSAAALTSTTRSALESLVTREERRTGSRTLAYKNVAQDVGSSSSWVRKFLAESNEVKEPRITLFQNIRASYESLCNRVEQENRNDELRLKLLKGDIDALVEGFMQKAGSQNQTGLGVHEAADNRLDSRVHDHGFDPPK
jgi:hypothetical protein